MAPRRFALLIFAAAMLGVAAGPGRVSAGPRTPPDKPSASQAISALINPIGYNFPVSNENNLVEVYPAVAYNPGRAEYLAVWYNDRPGNDDIRAQRVSRDGALLGGPFYVSAAGEGIDRRYPRVTYNVKAQQYLVVWEHQESSNGYSIHGRRLSGTGQLLDASDLIIRSAGANLYTPAKPVVAYAYTSDKYLVVWEETWHPMPISTSIYGQVVLATGALEGGYIPISDDPGGHFRTRPDLAYNLGRNEYLVAWEQLDPIAHLTDIYIRRVTGEGVPLPPDETELAYYTVSSTAPVVAALPVSPDGVFAVAWESHYAAYDWDILARPVLSDGTPQDAFDIAATGADETTPDIAGSLDRGQFLVTWKQAAASPFIFTFLKGRLISTSGSALDNLPSLGGLFADHPRLAAGSRGDFLAVFDDTPLAADSGIYGQLIGNRIYLPMVTR